MLQHFILAIGWILFSALHSLLASVSLKQKIARNFRSFRFYRLYYTLFATVSFAAVLIYQLVIDSVLLYRPVFLTKAAGVVIGGSGLYIMSICIKKYFGRLSGLKTLFVDEVHTGNELIVTGMHRYVRHPLYTGTFLFIWGLFIFVPYTSLLISNFIITVYTLIGIRWEEQKLIKEFGDSYKMYQKRVPKLIPAFKPSSAN